jgi:hypothetical protein
MLQRLQRDYHLTTISGGKHLHLAAEGVIATVKLPARKPITYRTNWNGGGDAA